MLLARGFPDKNNEQEAMESEEDKPIYLVDYINIQLWLKKNQLNLIFSSRPVQLCL